MADGALHEPLQIGRTDALARWRTTLVALAVGIALFIALFWAEGSAAVDVWEQSTAYGHCFLILPMTAYLLWDRRALIASSQPRCQPGWIVLALPATVLWLLAERLGIMEGRQLAAVAGLQVLFLVTLGWSLYWKLSGPLLYLLFLVPFGAFITPELQQFTTHFTITGLKLLDIPFYSDRFIIETPAGTFLIAEACAGLRFLIAAIAFGVFYAILSFRSVTKRFTFMALSVAVPIVANGLRALGIVVLGQILGSAEAAAADHLVYGWIFFSVIMVLLVLIGQAMRDVAPAKSGPVLAEPVSPRATPVFSAAFWLVFMALGPAASTWLDRASNAMPLPHPIAWVVPEGCDLVPQAAGVSLLRCAGHDFKIDVATYPARSTSSDLIAQRRRQTNEIAAEDVSASAISGNPQQIGAWTMVQTVDPDGAIAWAAWAGGHPTGSGLSSRIEQARRSIFGSDFQPVMITIAAVQPGRTASPQRKAAVEQITRFIQAQHDLSPQVQDLSRIAATH